MRRPETWKALADPTMLDGACWRLRVWRGLALLKPAKVRFDGLASCTRRAGRATLVVAEAMEEASLEARTRVEAIVTDGGESLMETGRARRRIGEKGQVEKRIFFRQCLCGERESATNGRGRKGNEARGNWQQASEVSQPKGLIGHWAKGVIDDVDPISRL